MKITNENNESIVQEIVSRRAMQTMITNKDNNVNYKTKTKMADKSETAQQILPSVTAEFHTSSRLGTDPELASAEEKGQKGTKLRVEDGNKDAVEEERRRG